MRARRTWVILVVLGATLLPLQARAATPTCVTFSDPKGDESPALDPSLDITSVRWRTTGSSLVATLTVTEGSGRPLAAPENRFEALFTVNNTDVVMFWKNGPARAQEANAFYQQGIRVDNVVVTALVDGGWSGNTLTMSVKYKELNVALGHPVLGKRFSKLSAQARAAYVYQDANVTWDTATAKSSATFVGGAACR